MFKIKFKNNFILFKKTEIIMNDDIIYKKIKEEH